MSRTMPPWAAAGAMSFLRNSRAGRIAWHALSRPCGAWRRRPEQKRMPSARAEPKRRRAGKPRRGKEPKPVDESPSEKAQSNFTDPALHSMPTNNKGWDDCGNAQARVDETCQIIVSCDVTDATNDKQQAEPMAQAPLLTLSQAGIELPRDDTGAPQ